MIIFLNFAKIKGCGNSKKKEPITKNNVNFTQSDKEAFRRKFESFDNNNDKKLSKNEFKTMIRQSGEKKTDNEIDCLVCISKFNENFIVIPLKTVNLFCQVLFT